MKAVILAGGMGIRLRPFTFSIPKPLLPVGETPILEIIIKRLKKFGFKEFVLAIGYKSRMVETYFGDGSEIGVSISYLKEKKPSGTAGPLVLFGDKFPLSANESFLLMNGDIMTNLNFSEMVAFHKKTNAEITVGVKCIKDKKSYGSVEVKGDFISNVIERPVFDRLVSAGIYVIKSPAVKEIPRNKFFTMPELINKLIAENHRVGAYRIKEFWLGMEELRHFEEVYKNKQIRSSLLIK